MFLRSLLVLFCWSMLWSAVFAAVTFDTNIPDPAKVSTKKKIALMFINNAKTTYDDELTTMVMENFDQILRPKHEILPGAKYVELLSKVGIVDIATTERADILSVVKGENIDIIIFVELQPFLRKDKVRFFTVAKEMTLFMPVKIIDMKENRYIYNGKFTEQAEDSSAIGQIGNKSVALKVLRSTLDKMNAVVLERMP